jgi:hypothetical protein
MVWGLELSDGFGRFFPEGEFFEYDEQLEAAFNAMTAEEKAYYNNRVSSYLLHVSQCFTFEHGTMHGEQRVFRPVAENEWPREFRMKRRYQELGALIKSVNLLLLVNKGFKDIVEELEPNVHQFRPIKLTLPTDEVYPGQYFTMVIGQYLSAFDPERSPRDIWRDIGGQYSAVVFNKDNAAVGAIKKSVVSGCHLWRDRLARHPNIFLSDTLRSEVKKAGLALPKHFPMKEV